MRRLAIGLLGVFLLFGMTGCMDKPQAGEIGVVRNGGPFDNKNIRQIIPNGSGNTWVGFGSETHFYPADTQQRFFTLGEQAGADAGPVTIPTSDGVEVSISGTFYLATAFDNSKSGQQSLRSFDTQFGTRTFPPNEEHAWNGTSGWSAYLAAIVEPVIANNLRETISGFSCAQLISSCALVQNRGNVNAVKVSSKNNQSNIASIQDKINANLVTDLRNTLGKDYFKNIRFNLKVVTLPDQLQNAINQAQSSFAQVSQAQAKVQSARAEAQANRLRQRGYSACHTCGNIDTIKAIAETKLTTWAPGASGVVVGR